MVLRIGKNAGALSARCALPSGAVKVCWELCVVHARRMIGRVEHRSLHWNHVDRNKNAKHPKIEVFVIARRNGFKYVQGKPCEQVYPPFDYRKHSNML